MIKVPEIHSSPTGAINFSSNSSVAKNSELAKIGMESPFVI